MNKQYIYFINGDWVLDSKATISFNDLGFLYGDGLFETMRFDNANIFSFDKHFSRLQNGLHILNLHNSYDKKTVYKLLETIIQKNNLNSGILRLMITRGTQSKIKDNLRPNLYISIKPFYSIPSKPVKIIFYNENQFPLIRFNPAVKSMNYLGNMLAKKATEKLNAFEPIFFNEDNLITECAIRNIFYIKENQVFTPSLDLGILSGVMRETIIDLVQSMGFKFNESHISYNDITDMEEAFITSTGIGLLPCYWDGWNSKFHITKSIKKELFKRINNS